MRNSLHNSLRSLSGITALEDTAPYKDTITSQLHHKRSIRWRSDSSSGEIHNGQTAKLGSLLQQLIRGRDILSQDTQLGIRHVAGMGDLSIEGSHVADGFNHVAGAGLALCADHGGAFADTAEGFAEVAAAADEGALEGVLFNVVGVVRGGEDFGLVNVIYANCLEDLFVFGNVLSAAMYDIYVE